MFKNSQSSGHCNERSEVLMNVYNKLWIFEPIEETLKTN